MPYNQVAPAKIASLKADEWKDFALDGQPVMTEPEGQRVLHLKDSVRVDPEQYSYSGVIPIVRHGLHDNPWLSVFFVDPTDTDEDGKEVRDPNPFVNVLYQAPSGSSADHAQAGLQFAAGSYRKFLVQQPQWAGAEDNNVDSANVEKIRVLEDLGTALFAAKVLPADPEAAAAAPAAHSTDGRTYSFLVRILLFSSSLDS